MQIEEKTAQTMHVSESEIKTTGEFSMIYCPECGAGPVAFQEGCFLCLSCGHTKCS